MSVAPGTQPPPWPAGPRGPFPKAEFDYLFSRVPRLTVEIVVFEPERGVVLALRDIPPNIGSLHIPGGTVRWGERVTDAYRRVALDELGIAFRAGQLIGYIEYPSHFENDLDSPVGLAFLAELDGAALPSDDELPAGCDWYRTLPPELYAEQRDFLIATLGFPDRGSLGCEPHPGVEDRPDRLGRDGL